MATFNELQKRAEDLRQSTAPASVTSPQLGQLLVDMLLYAFSESITGLQLKQNADKSYYFHLTRANSSALDIAVTLDAGQIHFAGAAIESNADDVAHALVALYNQGQNRDKSIASQKLIIDKSINKIELVKTATDSYSFKVIANDSSTFFVPFSLMGDQVEFQSPDSNADNVADALVQLYSIKQDKIADLAEIRQNASAGSAGVATLTSKVATLESNIASLTKTVNSKQNIISDLAEIRQNAAAGKAGVESLKVGKQDKIADLEEIRSNAKGAKEALEEQAKAVDELSSKAVTSADTKDEPEEGSDLYIADEEGNVLARFFGGHFRVKNFNSQQTLTEIANIIKNSGIEAFPEFSVEEDYAVGDIVRKDGLMYKFSAEHEAGEWSDDDVEQTDIIAELSGQVEHPVSTLTDRYADFDIADEEGYVLARFIDGHIKTKNFDSSNIRSNGSEGFMNKKIGIRDFSGWSITGGSATTSSLDSQLKFGTTTYEDCFDFSFSFICQGSAFELAFGKNATSLAGTMFSIGTDNNVKVYLNNSTLKKTIALSEIAISANRQYYISLKKRCYECSIFTIVVTDATSGISEVVEITSNSSLGIGYAWGQFAIYLKQGSGAVVSDLSVSMEADPELMIVGHSFIEGNSIQDSKDKRYAAIIEQSLGENNVYISGQGGATTATFSGGVFAKEASFFPNVKYVFFNLGTNDSNDSAIISGLNSLKTQAENLDIIPIFATISPDLRSGANLHETANNWIMQQDYVVDIRGAFMNDDGTVNTSSLLSDKVHPTIETHAKIANMFLGKYKNLFNYKK